MRWEALRSEIALCERQAYFFAGGLAPLPATVRREMTAVLEEWDTEAWDAPTGQWDGLDRCRAALAELMECRSERIVPCEGTSAAMNLAAAMVLVRWARDGARRANVVIHEEAHAAATYPWHNARRLGAPIELRRPRRRAGESEEEAVASAIDDKTIAVVLSHVGHRTGTRYGVTELASRHQQRDWALIVDAAQSAGAVPLNAEMQRADFVGFPAYKWLFGPRGVGFLVAADDWLESPGPVALGWAANASRSPGPPEAFDPIAGPNRFLLGTPNQIGLAGAAAGLELAVRCGSSRVAERVGELVGWLLAELEAAGYTTVTPADSARRAGIVSVEVASPEQLRARLRTDGVVVGVVDGRLRADVHAYNDLTDLERLVAGLGEAG
jgi:cysteine desulfurase / selenocysteine lyase